MVDEETQRIRDEVIRAMAEQGENAEALDFEMPAEAVVDEAGKSDDEVEGLFLTALFDDVRARSAQGMLVQPAQWLDAGLVPSHFAAEDWEMFVYEYLEECKAERDERDEREPAAFVAPIRSATTMVGVPRMRRVEKEPAESNLAKRSVEGAESKDPEQRVSAESTSSNVNLPCGDIVALVGKHSYYLFSTDHMTDAYARWSFLANEDDRVLTFVECVRDESRKYPRPMEASSLSNEPFKLSAEEIDELWRTVRESGAYPDLDTLTASNGDVYYFSTEYLTRAYAASLAEWNSVERDMFL